MKRLYLIILVTFLFGGSMNAQTYNMKVEKTNGETITIPVSLIKRVSYVTDEEGDDEGGNNSQIQLLMNSIWQLYSDWYHYSYWTTYRETKYVEYKIGEYTDGYRIKFNSNGYYDLWDWNPNGTWKKDEYPTAYIVDGNKLTIFWDDSGEDGIFNVEEDDNTIGTFTISGNTLTYEGNMIEYDSDWNDNTYSYTYSFKMVFKSVSW